MAGLGELSAGIAHEINTPVGYVMSNVNTLARYLNTIKELLTEYHTVTQAIHSEDEAAMEEHLHRIEELREEADLEFILEDVDSLVSDSAEGIVRVKEIVDDLRNFARTEESEMKEADINEGIEATLKMVWNELKYKCEVHKNLGDLPPPRMLSGTAQPGIFKPV
jgi:two-component system NtrC family sensor kinase